MNEQQMNDTITRGRVLTLHHEPAPDGGAVADEEIRVRQIPVGEYSSGYIRANDEEDLVAFLCGKPRAWALTLTPDSYEEVLTIGREVNAIGFFTYCQRRTERDAKAQADMIGIMASLKPEALEMAMKLGEKAPTNGRSPWPGFSPGLAPPPGR